MCLKICVYGKTIDQRLMLDERERDEGGEREREGGRWREKLQLI